MEKPILQEWATLVKHKYVPFLTEEEEQLKGRSPESIAKSVKEPLPRNSTGPW